MPDESAAVQVPLEVLQKLASVAEEMGIDLPGVSRFAPKVDITRPIRTLSLEMGRLLAKRNIFLKGDALVTVDPVSGDTKAMTASRLCGWVEEFCTITAQGSQRTRESLSREDAALILEQDIFRDCIRPLEGVHLMRLPVRRPSGAIEFLSAGYDEESRIYTADTLPYEMDWELDKGCDFIIEVCSEIPWNGLDEQGDLRRNRSFAVHVAAMLGTYCRGLFPPGTLAPMIAYFANKPGSGKTRLAEMALAPVFGFIAATSAPKDAEKMDVKLETVARAMLPYVLFDDIGGALRSNALNKFITETLHGGRPYHSNSEFFQVPNVTRVFVTANELPMSEDLDRRALIAELFLADEIRGRKFKRELTGQWLALPETRKQFLAALCSIVRHWMRDAEGNGGQYLLHVEPVGTFEEWTKTIGGMVCCAGFADPLARPERDVGGAGQEDEIKKLLIAVASEKEYDTQITRKELVEAAREHGWLEDLVGTKDGGDLDAKENKTFGRRMQRWRGQRLRDERGRVFQFSHKRNKSGVSYPLLFIRPAEGARQEGRDSGSQEA